MVNDGPVYVGKKEANKFILIKKEAGNFPAFFLLFVTLFLYGCTMQWTE